MPEPAQYESSSTMRTQFSSEYPVGSDCVPSVWFDGPGALHAMKTNAESRNSGRMVQSVTPEASR